MTIDWTPTAISHLLQLNDYLFQRNPTAADRIVDRIYDMAASLDRFPLSGRSGRVHGTRELVVPATNYIVAYRIAGEAVQILAVMHGAQRWPRHFDTQLA